MATLAVRSLFDPNCSSSLTRCENGNPILNRSASQKREKEEETPKRPIQESPAPHVYLKNSTELLYAPSDLEGEG
jgi:hypothetical protein